MEPLEADDNFLKRYLTVYIFSYRIKQKQRIYHNITRPRKYTKWTYIMGGTGGHENDGYDRQRRYRTRPRCMITELKAVLFWKLAPISSHDGGTYNK